MTFIIYYYYKCDVEQIGIFDRTSTHRRQLNATLSAMKKAPFMKENYIQVCLSNYERI